MADGPPMTLAEKAARRLILAGLARDPALAVIRACNAAIHRREAPMPP